MPRRLRRVLPALVLLTLACESSAPDIDVRQGDAPPPGLAPATLTFTADWQLVSGGGPLVAGNPVEVSYAADRLTQCRGEQNGKPAWTITGYQQLEDGPVGAFEAGGYSPSQNTQPPIFTPADSGDLALWFHNTNVWGCSAYDSDFGANWHVQVGGSLSFKTGWTVETFGAPRPGAALVIAYDPARLPDCRGTKYGFDAWNIRAHYRFDDGPEQTAMLTQAQGNVQVAVPAVLAAPVDAAEVELWFENQSYSGCRAWDSQYGANYHFTLE